MNWLIWKEYRLHRLILIVGLVLLLGLYIAPLVMWLKGFSPDLVSEFLFAAFNGSVGLSVITFAALGGNSIACERADRSAEFLAYQPVSHSAKLVSKLALPLLAAVVVWGTNLLLAWFLCSTAAIPSRLDGSLVLVGAFVVAAFCAFSMAWLISAVQDSPTFAICGGLIAPMLIAVGLSLIGYVLGPATFDQAAWVSAFVIVAGLTGLACFIGGTAYYLRRVEP